MNSKSVETKYKLVTNYQKVDNEINKVQDTIKRKYLCNKSYMDFLHNLQSNTIKKYNKIINN